VFATEQVLLFSVGGWRKTTRRGKEKEKRKKRRVFSWTGRIRMFSKSSCLLYTLAPHTDLSITHFKVLEVTLII
jgi:hypothetical protein